jgi:hypothetical protein
LVRLYWEPVLEQFLCGGVLFVAAEEFRDGVGEYLM